MCSFLECADVFLCESVVFWAETPEMPVGTPAPIHKRKKAPKIITDLAHITQDGKVSKAVCADVTSTEDR